MSRYFKRWGLCRAGSVIALGCAAAWGFGAQVGSADMSAAAPADAKASFDMDLDAMMAVDVTSVAGVVHPWFITPAAITVITAEDVRRTGHPWLAEALRLAPGLDALRGGAHASGVSVRGFDSLFSNKLLVLIDGRTIGDPLFQTERHHVKHAAYVPLTCRF